MYGREFLPWMNRKNRIKPYPQGDGTYELVLILSILFIHVKKRASAVLVAALSRGVAR
jgi:hypothetical protein